jgi:hypothetical protein
MTAAASSVVYLNYLYQSPAGFEANLSDLERAHWKSLSDARLNGRPNTAPRIPGIQMRFAMEMKDRPCPPYLGDDWCLVFKLLKGHLCLQDSAMTWLLDVASYFSFLRCRFYRGMYGVNQGQFVPNYTGCHQSSLKSSPSKQKAVMVFRYHNIQRAYRIEVNKGQCFQMIMSKSLPEIVFLADGRCIMDGGDRLLH